MNGVEDNTERVRFQAGVAERPRMGGEWRMGMAAKNGGQDCPPYGYTGG